MTSRIGEFNSFSGMRRKEDLEPSKNIGHTFHNKLDKLSSGKYITMIPRFDYGTLKRGLSS